MHLLAVATNFTPDQVHLEALAWGLLALFALGVIAGVLIGHRG